MKILKTSENLGFFQYEGVDYPKGHYLLSYDNLKESESERNFTICNIYDNSCLLKSRGYAEIQGVESWSELLNLLSILGVLAIGGVPIPYELAVSMGQVQGTKSVDKFGVNLDITTSTDPEDITEIGGTYNFDAFGTAPILYLSSSNNLDNQPVYIRGLDIYGYEVVQTITLNGQTNALLTTPLWRVYVMENRGTAKTLGIVYCHTAITTASGTPPVGNMRALFRADTGRTLMAIYTIPRGFVGFLKRGEIGIELDGNSGALAEYAHCHYESRRLNGIFTVKKAVTVMVSQGVYQDKRTFPDIIPAMTDIKIVADVVSQNMGLWATFDIELKAQDQFTTEYLTAIGQPYI